MQCAHMTLSFSTAPSGGTPSHLSVRSIVPRSVFDRTMSGGQAGDEGRSSAVVSDGSSDDGGADLTGATSER